MKVASEHRFPLSDWQAKYHKEIHTDENGFSTLLKHKCSRCGEVHVPQMQRNYSVGLLAVTGCSCGLSVVTAVGEDFFCKTVMQWSRGAGGINEVFRNK